MNKQQQEVFAAIQASITVHVKQWDAADEDLGATLLDFRRIASTPLTTSIEAWLRAADHATTLEDDAAIWPVFLKPWADTISGWQAAHGAGSEEAYGLLVDYWNKKARG